MHEFQIARKDSMQRLDKYLSRCLPLAPKSFLYKALRGKDIRLNGQKAAGNELLKEGDRIQIRFPDVQYFDLGGKEVQETIPENSASIAKYANFPEAERPESAAASLGKQEVLPACFGTILYEDEDLILVDKKAGILSQKAKPEDFSLNEALLQYCGGKTALFTPSVCNRLDRGTSGLMLFAKTYRGAAEAAKMLKDRKARKFYLAAVAGLVTEKQHLKARLTKDSAKNIVRILDADALEGTEIETAWEPIAAMKRGEEEATLLKVELLTGKTHQIRAQLASLGHPILGDPKYGGKKRGIPAKRMMLHSYEMEIPGKGNFRTKLPHCFTEMFPGIGRKAAR